MPKYDHIISLGLNCEIAFQLRNNHGFVESNLLTWAGTNSISLLAALTARNLIFSGAIHGNQDNPKSNLFFCGETGVYFHGRSHPSQLRDKNGVLDPGKVNQDREECISRVHHLIEKDNRLACDNSSKLYVIGLHPNFNNFKTHLNDYIMTIYRILARTSRNSSCLFILEAEQESVVAPVIAGGDRYYIRFIKNFAPRGKATVCEFNDMEGYRRIFQEFEPMERKSENKKYKYEMEN